MYSSSRVPIQNSFRMFCGYPELVAIRDLDGDLAQGVIIEPELLKVLHLPDPWAKLHYVIEAQVKPRQISQIEHL